MKIGILTHQYINNYGAFLQAWALRQAIAEIFPEDKCYGDKGLYKQLDYYKDVHNRIRCKQKGDFSPDWYWTSSPRSGNSTNWCGVSTYGSANYNPASYANVAAPICFRIA